jgi:quercetin dioxygenase-like cupin family protein
MAKAVDQLTRSGHQSERGTIVGLSHAQAGQVISIAADESGAESAGTRTLLKTAHVEVIRLVLPQGKTIPAHRAPGEIIVHGLTGRVRFEALGRSLDIEKGQLFYLPAGESHAVTAVEDCSFLLTILLASKAASS